MAKLYEVVLDTIKLLIPTNWDCGELFFTKIEVRANQNTEVSNSQQ